MDSKIIDLVIVFFMWVSLCVCYAQPNLDGPSPTPTLSEDTIEKSDGEGDRVIFKKGTELKNVKVIRESPVFVEIEYLPGEPPLKIPASQVAKVIYANKPEKERTKISDTIEISREQDIIPGDEVSSDLYKALMAPISEEEFRIENEDYLEIIRALTEKFGIPLQIDENLEATSPETRKVSFDLPARTTLLDFLRNDLSAAVPDLRIILHYDKLTLQRKVSSESQSDSQPNETPGE